MTPRCCCSAPQEEAYELLLATDQAPYELSRPKALFYSAAAVSLPEMSKAKAQQVGNRYLVRKGLASGEVNAISKTSGFRAHVRQWISRKGGCNRLAKVFMAAVKRRAQQQQRGSGVPSLREGLSDTPFVW